MPAFSSAIEAQLSGATVRAVPLARFDFRSGVMRLWQGFGRLVAGGETWEGIGRLGSLSPVRAGPGLAVEEMTFNLSTEAEALQHFKADSEDATGREVECFLQFFDLRQTNEAGDWVDWQRLDDPLQFFWGVMGPLSAERSETLPGARAGRILSVTASSPLINRARPPFGYYSNSDHQARHPGDNMFVYAARMASAKVHWPDFTV